MTTNNYDPRHLADALFHSISLGAIITDERGYITYINPVALSMLGHTESEMLGHSFIKRIVSITEDGKSLARSDRPIIRAAKSMETVHTRARYLHADGHIIPVSLSTSPIIVDNACVGAIQIFRDTSLEDEIDRMKSDFISLASHQLRTPLSAIQTYAHLIVDGYLGDINDEQRRSLGTILTAAGRMNELVSTLLSITRVEGGNMTVALQDVNVVELAEDVVKEHILEASEHEIDLTLKASKDMPLVETDNLLFREVLSNIISNALKYTQPHGTVTVSIKNRQNDVYFAVKDTGLGIPKKAQSQVFSKFFRASNVVRRETNGTGLGLYLVKGLMDALGGKIWFKSEENVGTTFYITLPKH